MNDTTVESSTGLADSLIEFPETQWGLMDAIRSSDPEKLRELLGRLCVYYNAAIASYFEMKCGDPSNAQDLTQAFHEHLLGRNRLEHYERRANIRFRNYLSAALRNFWLSRLPKVPATSEMRERDEFHTDVSPSDAQRGLDERVALDTHRHALERLRVKLGKAGKEDRFRVLSPFLLNEGCQEKYEAAGKLLELKANAVKKAVHDLRQQYYDCFCNEVGRIVSDADLPDELRYLIQLLPDALAREGSVCLMIHAAPTPFQKPEAIHQETS